MRLGTETACCAPICRGLEIFKSKKIRCLPKNDYLCQRRWIDFNGFALSQTLSNQKLYPTMGLRRLVKL